MSPRRSTRSEQRYLLIVLETKDEARHASEDWNVEAEKTHEVSSKR